jgi:hypothetical protein
MINSVSNFNISQNMPTTNLSSKTTEEANESTNEKIAESNGQNSKTDTVEISNQARAALHSSTVVASQNSASSKKAAMPSLTGLTEAQMHKLVSNGTITTGQVQVELAKRAAAKNSGSITSTHQNNAHGIDLYA